jgi:hypothetical protein
MIIQYVKRKNQPIGCFVAVRRDDGEIVIGWSLCRKGDRFNKQLAKNIALGRCMNGSYSALPFSLFHQMMDFISRAERYFKTKRSEMIC